MLRLSINIDLFTIFWGGEVRHREIRKGNRRKEHPGIFVADRAYQSTRFDGYFR